MSDYLMEALGRERLIGRSGPELGWMLAEKRRAAATALEAGGLSAMRQHLEQAALIRHVMAAMMLQEEITK